MALFLMLEVDKVLPGILNSILQLLTYYGTLLCWVLDVAATELVVVLSLDGTAACKRATNPLEMGGDRNFAATDHTHQHWTIWTTWTIWFSQSCIQRAISVMHPIAVCHNNNCFNTIWGIEPGTAWGLLKLIDTLCAWCRACEQLAWSFHLLLDPEQHASTHTKTET